jgi:hypothetical protein
MSAGHGSGKRAGAAEQSASEKPSAAIQPSRPARCSCRTPDDRGLGQHLAGLAVDEDRHPAHRPEADVLGPALLALDQVALERHVELVERDEGLLAVRRERVEVQDEHPPSLGRSAHA